MAEHQPSKSEDPKSKQGCESGLLDELAWRGLIHQCTDEAGLREHLATGTRSIYAGFDPTAPSLTIGNLVPIMVLAHVKRCGHRPVVVMGGGTGLIGDPSGKSAERTLMTKETVEGHIRAQRPIVDAVLGRVEGAAYTVLNNADWLCQISYLDALRDIGKHFSVNMMMAKESVRSRLEDREHGISYTEFSYMILQAYDFLHLYREHGVSVQFGGSDQYGNIVAGCDLIRRDAFVHGGAEPHTFGLTSPLVTKADGGKFGKTESGAIWLTADRTSPYAYFQFWLNASDADAAKWIKIFTFLSQPEVESITAAHAANPGARELQRRLAREATAILHGPDAAERAEAAGKALFSGDIAHLDERTLNEVLADAPSSTIDRAELAKAEAEAGGMELVGLLTRTGLAASNREAREFLANKSVSVNGRVVGPEDRLKATMLLHGSLCALRRGKKSWHLVRFG
jgi:tyrosyl-tRNA synthetase